MCVIMQVNELVPLVYAGKSKSNVFSRSSKSRNGLERALSCSKLFLWQKADILNNLDVLCVSGYCEPAAAEISSSYLGRQ